jgi:hypothetical protein
MEFSFIAAVVFVCFYVASSNISSSLNIDSDDELPDIIEYIRPESR